MYLKLSINVALLVQK